MIFNVSVDFNEVSVYGSEKAFNEQLNVVLENEYFVGLFHTKRHFLFGLFGSDNRTPTLGVKLSGKSVSRFVLSSWSPKTKMAVLSHDDSYTGVEVPDWAYAFEDRFTFVLFGGLKSTVNVRCCVRTE